MTRVVGAHALVFNHNGSVEIQTRFGEKLWQSKDHPPFNEEFGSFVSHDESKEILEWLVEDGVISDQEADRLEIDEVSIAGDDEEDDDEDDDEDEDSIADDDGDEY